MGTEAKMGDGRPLTVPALRRNNWYPWAVVIALGLMSAGTTGTYSIVAGSFVTPVCEDLGFDYAEYSFYFTAVLIGLSATLPFVGKLIPRVVGRAWHPLIECILLAAGAAMGFYTEVWMFIASAFVIGACFAFTTGVCMSNVIDQWFRGRAGFAIGLAWAVNSLCVLCLSPLITVLIENLGWRQGFLVLAAISAVLILPASIFVIRFRPVDKGMLPYGVAEENAPVPDAMGDPDPGIADAKGVPFSSAVKSPAFFCCVAFLCLVQLTCCMNQLFPTYATEVGFDPLVGGLMVSAASLFDIFLNPLVGGTCDKVDSSKAIVGWVAISALSFVLLMLGAGNSWLSVFAAGVNDVMFAISGTAMPILVLAIFGSRDFGRIFSLVCAAGYIVGAFGMPVMMQVYAWTESFSGVFLFCIALDALIALLALLARKTGASLSRE